MVAHLSRAYTADDGLHFVVGLKFQKIVNDTIVGIAWRCSIIRKLDDFVIDGCRC